MWWFCAENIGAERWCECGSSGAQPVAAGDCRPDEGEREKDEGGVDAGEQVREGGPDERPNEPASLPACATGPSLATGSRWTPVAGGQGGAIRKNTGRGDRTDPAFGRCELASYRCDFAPYRLDLAPSLSRGAENPRLEGRQFDLG